MENSNSVYTVEGGGNGIFCCCKILKYNIYKVLNVFFFFKSFSKYR